MGLFQLFRRNKNNDNEFEKLNNACNEAFEAAFSKCRIDFGREMVEIMDKKSKLLEEVKSKKTSTPAQELLAKKLLELIPVYFNIIEIYVSLKKNDHPNERQTQPLNEIDEKMKRVYSLINTLNSQFYLSSDELSGISACDEVINEAEALRNVINENYIK